MQLRQIWRLLLQQQGVDLAPDRAVKTTKQKKRPSASSTGSGHHSICYTVCQGNNSQHTLRKRWQAAILKTALLPKINIKPTQVTEECSHIKIVHQDQSR